MTLMERIRRIFYPYKLGIIDRDPEDNRDYHISKILNPALLEKLPEEFEIQSYYQTKQQWSRGSCTSQAVSGSHEPDEEIPLSAHFVMACTKHIEGNTSYGAFTRNGFKALQKYGACSEASYPEPGPEMSWKDYIDFSKISETTKAEASRHKIDSYWREDITLDEIKLSLYQFNKDLPDKKQKPLTISMNWFQSFKPDSNGILPAPNKSVGGHAVRIRGWTTINNRECLIIENSWGKNWGVNRKLKNGKTVYSICYLPVEYINKIWDSWLSLDVEEIPKSGLRLIKGSKATVYLTIEQTMEKRPILSGIDYENLVGKNWNIIQVVPDSELDKYKTGPVLIITKRNL